MFPVFLAAAAIAVVVTVIRWFGQTVAHQKRLDQVKFRVHVNGIRGKSTVTRIVAGMFREADVTTIAKSTGSFAAVITAGGHDVPIKRSGAPTIMEQLKIIKSYVSPDVEAIIVECMAIVPAYQQVSEEKMVRSTIGVLTNVREDHQDVMGETLPEIARSLASTCPHDGLLVTAEQDVDLREVIQDVADERGTRVVFADPDSVTDEDIARFDYIAFKENVAIGLAIAEIVGIPRDIAITGMVRAAPDPGVLRLKHLRIGDKLVTWANLFAVNDRESMVAAMERLQPYRSPRTTTVGILNNRADRQLRATQFADVAVRDLDFDRLVTFGAYEQIVTQRLIDNGWPADRIANLGEQRKPTTEQMIEELVHNNDTPHVLVVGFVNIHTRQAEMMLDYFEHEAEAVDPGAVPDLDMAVVA